MTFRLSDRARHGLTACHVPQSLHAGLIRYFERGIEPGGFLCCVLDNDLSGALMRADEKILFRLKNIVRWLHEFAPPGAWGRPGAVRDYITAFHGKHDKETAP